MGPPTTTVWISPFSPHGHDHVALLVCAWIWQIDSLERQSYSGGLPLQQSPSRRMHGDAIELLVYDGKQADKFNPRVLSEQVNRPRAVFPTAPTQQCFLLHFFHRRTSKSAARVFRWLK